MVLLTFWKWKAQNPLASFVRAFWLLTVSQGLRYYRALSLHDMTEQAGQRALYFTAKAPLVLPFQTTDSWMNSSFPKGRVLMMKPSLNSPIYSDLTICQMGTKFWHEFRLGHSCHNKTTAEFLCYFLNDAVHYTLVLKLDILNCNSLFETVIRNCRGLPFIIHNSNGCFMHY